MFPISNSCSLFSMCFSEVEPTQTLICSKEGFLFVKVIRFGTIALVILVASLLTACQSERLAVCEAPLVAIASPELLHLLHVSPLMTESQQSSETSGQDENAKGDTPLPDGEGRDTTKKVCGKCHSTDIWAKKRHTRDQWSAVIDDMTAKGMNASDKDLDTVLDYLSAHLAPEKESTPAPPSPPQ
jgi:cytochrome c5